jgi:hypothetical protein
MFDKDSINIWKSYKLISEVSEKFVDEIKDAIEGKELPFNNIFGNKLRLSIPVSGTETYHEILNVIKQLPNYSSFDPQKKEVIKRIKLDVKYGGGEKEQRINLGKAITSLKLTDDLKKKYLDWYATYNTNIPELENLKDYRIIISRSPIDVLRMSDVGTIRSCHSEGNTYFQCAIQEAKSGGLIAFLVKKQDLDRLNETEFQNEEIFEDKKRGIRGINPLSRLRIRRYSDSDTDTDIAVPEIRLYGDRLSGFYSSIKNFLLQKQEGLDINNIYKNYRNKNITRRGGSYTDSSDSELFNRMFDTDTFTGSVEQHEDDHGEETVDRAQQFENELNEFQIRYANDLKRFQIYYNVEDYDDGENVYYSAGASMKISTDLDLTDDFKNFELSTDTLKAIKNYQEGVKYRDRIPYGFKNDDYFRKIKKFVDYLVKLDDFFENDLSELYISSTGDIHLNVCFGDDCNGTSFNTDEYSDFCRLVSSLDDEADKLEKLFIRALKVFGFIEGLEQITEEDPEEFNDKLKNFEYDDDDQELIITKKTLAFNPQKTEKNKWEEISNLNAYAHVDQQNLNLIKGKMEVFLINYLNNHYNINFKSKEIQTSFEDFMESINSDSLEKYGIEEVNVSLNKERDFYNKDGIEINTTLRIKINQLTSDVANILLFLDKNVDDIKNAMSLLTRLVYKVEDNEAINLRKLYRKYFI